MGRPPRAGLRSSPPWPNGASMSSNWPTSPANPTPIPWTCSAIWPTTPPCAPAGSGPNACAGETGLFPPLRPRGQGHLAGTPGHLRRPGTDPVCAARGLADAAHFHPWQRHRDCRLLRRPGTLRDAVNQMQICSMPLNSLSTGWHAAHPLRSDPCFAGIFTNKCI